MNLDERVGQVWVLDESVELIVRGVAPVGRITEVRWTTLVLWSKEKNEHDPFVALRSAGSLDQAGESAFRDAELGDNEVYHNWKRIL